MDITVVGTGYVGLVAGTCLSEMGHNVTCVDNDQDKIRSLEAGKVPIYEPRLEELIEHNTEKKRLRFSTDLARSVESAEIVFIAVGTPESADGSADVSMVHEVARAVAASIRAPIILATKSTVPVGTASAIEAIVKATTDIPIDVVSNPEFMKEGAAVDDFMKPDRIIIGTDSESAREAMADLYAPFNRTSNRIVFMDPRSAEMTKYVANAMLATRISFMNEMANLCERVGADISKVRLGVGSDPRIGPSFLFPGAGFGGSCFPKDIRALLHTASRNGMTLEVLSAVEDVNARQKVVLVEKIVRAFGESLAGKRFAVWGLAFKPQTDDMREAPSVEVIEGLLARGAEVSACDPEANAAAKRLFGDRIRIHDDMYACLENADALVVVTEWNEFRRPDFRKIKALLRQPMIFDGRNVYNPQRMIEMGFDYSCIGRARGNPW